MSALVTFIADRVFIDDVEHPELALRSSLAAPRLTLIDTFIANRKKILGMLGSALGALDILIKANPTLLGQIPDGAHYSILIAALASYAAAHASPPDKPAEPVKPTSLTQPLSSPIKVVVP